MKIEKRVKNVVSDTTEQMRNFVMDTLGTDEVLWENEVRANNQVSNVLLISAIIMVASLILDMLNIYDIKLSVMANLTGINLVFQLVPFIMCKVLKGEKKFLKLLMLTCLVISYALTDLVLGYNVVLLMAIPVVLSSRYYNRKLTAFIALVTSLLFGTASGFSYHFGTIDLNHVTYLEKTTLVIEQGLEKAVKASNFSMSDYISDILFHSYLPKYLLFIIIAIVSAEIAYRGYTMTLKQNNVAKEHARIDTELNVARKIQEHALPIVHDLKEHPAFDLAASMEPAKEIGGDFYDFMMLDDTHLALVIADVSGKGVPAAMFMMVSKIFLDNSLQERKSPGAVLAEVNHLLCEKNLDDMFVTVWLGIVDLTNGKVVTANGGHEYPLIRRKNGNFEVFKDKHGLVLGAMDGMRYVESEFTLEPGDTLFVYTDGVPEANNEAKELFTLDATCAALNGIKAENMETMLSGLRSKINAFAGEAEQFDDITMMGFTLNHYVSEEGLTVEPTRESILQMQQYLESEMENAMVPLKIMMKMNVAIDEIYSNIVYYSQAAWANGTCEVSDTSVSVTFRDNGIPYNPLQKEDPDITLSSEEREVGGLGIFMTRKLMTEFDYEYKDGINITRLVLNK